MDIIRKFLGDSPESVSPKELATNSSFKTALFENLLQGRIRMNDRKNFMNVIANNQVLTVTSEKNHLKIDPPTPGFASTTIQAPKLADMMSNILQDDRAKELIDALRGNDSLKNTLLQLFSASTVIYDQMASTDTIVTNILPENTKHWPIKFNLVSGGNFSHQSLQVMLYQLEAENPLLSPDGVPLDTVQLSFHWQSPDTCRISSQPPFKFFCVDKLQTIFTPNIGLSNDDIQNYISNISYGLSNAQFTPQWK